MNSEKTRRKYIQEIESAKIIKKEKIKRISIGHNFINGAFVEISGNTNTEYKVFFYDGEKLIHSSNIKCGHWTRTNRQYYTNWKIIVKNDKDEIIYNESINLENKKVYIAMGSSSLGDSLAWIPYVEEFRKQHNCEVIVSTFKNDLFESQYPKLKFVKPGDTVENIHAQYNIGWYYQEKSDVVDFNRNPNDFKKQPLQKTATDILGLKFKEIKPLLKLPNALKQKKVGIAIHGTAQSKYWNNEEGWQNVVNFLKEEGYEVMLYSKEEDGYMGNKHPSKIKKFKGGSLQEVANDMTTCEFFIGIGSGLSWLAWASNLPVILISGFSDDYTETISNTLRVINKSSCFGCFNKHKLDAGDWNWCPEQKNTKKQFECSKSITSKMVIDKIKLLINPNKINEFDWGYFNNQPGFKEQILKEIFIDKIYEKYFKIKKEHIVMDIGSSVGPFAYSIADTAKHTYCIEPSIEEFPTLEKNLKGKRVTCINKAISNNNNTSFNEEVYGKNKKVSNITFKNLLKEYNIEKINFLKIDCEGGEYDVFTKENIEALKKIDFISGEWHLRKESKEKFRYFRDNILPLFHGFEVFSVDGVNIKHSLHTEEFLDYYTEIIIYIEN